MLGRLLGVSSSVVDVDLRLLLCAKSVADVSWCESMFYVKFLSA
jgi:hypothetical protein